MTEKQREARDRLRKDLLKLCKQLSTSIKNGDESEEEIDERFYKLQNKFERLVKLDKRIQKYMNKFESDDYDSDDQEQEADEIKRYGKKFRNAKKLYDEYKDDIKDQEEVEEDEENESEQGETADDSSSEDTGSDDKESIKEDNNHNKKKFQSKKCCSDNDEADDDNEIKAKSKGQPRKNENKKNRKKNSSDDEEYEHTRTKKSRKPKTSRKKVYFSESPEEEIEDNDYAKKESKRKSKSKNSSQNKQRSRRDTSEDEGDYSEEEQTIKSKKNIKSKSNNRSRADDEVSENRKSKAKRRIGKNRKRSDSDNETEDSNDFDLHDRTKHRIRRRNTRRYSENSSDEDIRKKPTSDKTKNNDTYRFVNWTEQSEATTRFALGSDVFIGALYDGRTDTFHSDSLFLKPLPSKMLEVQRLNDNSAEVSQNDKLSNRFDLLQVHPQQQLSVLTNLSHISGHAKYLVEEASSVGSRTLLYSYQVEKEKLTSDFGKLKPYINKNILQNSRFTHVVVQLVWGLRCTITLEPKQTNSNTAMGSSNNNDTLNEEIDRLRNLLTQHGSSTMRNSSNMHNFQLIFHSDLAPRGRIMDNVFDVVDFVFKIPSFLESTDTGKGKPLICVMVPLSTFSNFNNVSPSQQIKIKELEGNVIKTVIDFFEEINEVKRKLNDVIKDLRKYDKYFPDDFLNFIDKAETFIVNKEKSVKEDLSDKLPEVRSGKISSLNLIKKIKKLQDSDSKFQIIKNVLDDTDFYVKIDFIENCLSENVHYLDKNDDTLSRRIQKSKECFVLLKSKALENADPELSQNAQQLFRAMSRKAKQSCEFIVLDFDLRPDLETNKNVVTIQHYENGKLISDDYFENFKSRSSLNFMRIRNPRDLLVTNEKPPLRVALKLICPNSRSGSCPNDKLIWICENCTDVVQYAFDDHFYCFCGKAESQAFEFKCGSPDHGDEFVKIGPGSSLRMELNDLKPPKEINILILGQSGVGKSTWINGIVNYLQYSTLQEAERGGALHVIPASFVVTYTTNEQIVKQEVKVGEEDQNEVTSTGKSATQGPKTYNFLLPPDTLVRLVDTPGLGDTDGIEKDKENMKAILDHISHLKELHGICVLMKSNETRVGALFRFCIMELLVHLHKNAARNLLFCFTNSRSSFYSPGDTASVIEEILKANKLDQLIQLTQNTSFCLDNEAFRYLCTLKYKNIPHTDEDEKIYSASWEKSVTETNRLFDRIKKLQPHMVQDTTTLCNARNRILNLMKPIADITQTIQLNLAAIEDKKREINTSNESLDDLAKKLYMPQITLEAKPLSYPRTVCTSKECVQYYHMKDINVTNIEYTQICHDHCYLKNIVPETLPNEGLRHCWAMGPDKTTCHQCNCTYDFHMHITYTQERVTAQVLDKDVENQIQYKQDAKSKIEAHIKKLEATIEEYEKEQKIIIDVCLKFGAFLKENAIAPYNDGFKSYLQYLVEQEENKVNKTSIDDKLLKNLKEMMARYEEEEKILKKTMSDPNAPKNVSVGDIQNLEQTLYGLKLCGAQIKSHVEMALKSNVKAMHYGEQPLPIRVRYNALPRNYGSTPVSAPPSSSFSASSPFDRNRSFSVRSSTSTASMANTIKKKNKGVWGSILNIFK